MNNKLKIITYNIDGLPDKLNLNDLPWILKPITWVYKLIKKTTIIKINDNIKTAENIENISLYLLKADADIVGIQEDFNYHDELMSCLNRYYDCGKLSEKFSLNNLFSKIEFFTHFPLPRFKSDGINLLMKNNRINYSISSEDIVSWKKSNGYICHANDLLTHKGFRTYTITIDNTYNADVYVLHMDADFYDPEKCPDVTGDIKARKSQIDQLLSYIFNKYEENKNKIDGNRPIIIMGDTNSYDKYTWDVENIKYLINSFNNISYLHCVEAMPDNYSDCDRIFVINNDKSEYKLELSKCYFDKDIKFSDHKPLIAEYTILKNKN